MNSGQSDSVYLRISYLVPLTVEEAEDIAHRKWTVEGEDDDSFLCDLQDAAEGMGSDRRRALIERPSTEADLEVEL